MHDESLKVVNSLRDFGISITVNNSPVNFPDCESAVLK